MNEATQLLRVRNLAISYYQDNGWQQVVKGVNFTISRSEAFGLVGESGCGKSTVALQLLAYRHPASRIDSGQVLFEGQNLLALPRRELDRLRGNRISYVPQNPVAALSPNIKVGQQIIEVLTSHRRSTNVRDASAAAMELFDLVGLSQPSEVMRRYPHQLSGGQQQRICIAIAIACEPDLVILDEPTTGLDATTQEQIVGLLIDLRSRIHMSMLYVTHDLGVLSQIADRIGVMYAGQMVEVAPSASLFSEPRHPYTQGLIASIPRIDKPNAITARPLRGLLQRDKLPAGCPFEPRCIFAERICAENPQKLEIVTPLHQVACQRWRLLAPPSMVADVGAAPRSLAHSDVPTLALQGISVRYGPRHSWLSQFTRKKRKAIVNDISFSITSGETLALVGESGSGKTTIARAISGLVAPESGQLLLDGQMLPNLVQLRSKEQRRQIQYIFQNPDASLNPRARIGKILRRPLDVFFQLESKEKQLQVQQALLNTMLDATYVVRFPDQLSGGERQRIAIARALVAKPELLICDEILSALDVSVQAAILDLLRRLRHEYKIAILFISHDLGVVRQLSDKVAVIYSGQLMEIGATDDVFNPPFHPYTETLLAATLELGTPHHWKRARRSVPKQLAKHEGCEFAGRCHRQLGSICCDETPPWRLTPDGHAIRCHWSLEDLNENAVAAGLYERESILNAPENESTKEA